MTVQLEEMTIQQLLSQYPYLIDVFKQNGLGKFEKPDVLQKLGPFLKLGTAMRALSIHKDTFLSLLNEAISEHADSSTPTLMDAPHLQRNLTVLALLPCGMKMPFNRAFDEFIQQYNAKHQTRLHYLVEGNVNHEVSYYAYIESIERIEELPDIIISSDINSFYHESFKQRFLSQHYFADLTPADLNSDMATIDFSDPRKQFTMLSANLLVLVAIKDKVPDFPASPSWADILEEKYTNSVVMRGQKDFFCNGVLMPFYKIWKEDGVRQMGRSVKTGVHPSEMVKMIDSSDNDVAPLYIMPYFFAQKIKHKERVTIHVPKEGAIVSPVQMLVKKDKLNDVSEITDFLLSQSLGQVCADAYFPSVHPKVHNPTAHISPLLWLGWDYIGSVDVGKTKKDIEAVFMQSFYESGGAV
ncbi:MAG: ABC transporter substrate-binding protein [Deltaproteobacteria bacterium]|nr:ABC transporter substrate-binding protein [Deltaproteobacteria bacterium]